MRYEEGYRAYCENLCGGYIDRPDPTAIYPAYEQIQTLFYDSSYIQALRNVWPKYDSSAEYIQDLQFEIFGDEALHELLQSEINIELEKLLEEGNEVG